MSSGAKRQRDAFHGEQACCQCSNKAYYRSGDRLYCGVHSRRLVRTELPKNPDAKRVRQERFAAWERMVEETARANAAAGRRGRLTVSKLRMMREPDHTDGVRNVFPNNKHEHRVDGFGCSALSPMRLGPVDHKQPSVPVALNIENFHQFSKVFERDVRHTEDGIELLDDFFRIRNAAFADPVPHRHKYPDDKGVGGNKNVPLFSLHIKPSGVAQRYTYIESRYFYCSQYELLAKQTAEFAELRRQLDAGYNLQIVGYDGYEVTKTPWEHYNDASRPFGHELVLYCLLAIEDPHDYPWRRFYREHTELYE
jgi:hypothetical protein